MPVAKREAAGYLIREHALPIRRACNCVTLSRSAFYRPLADWTVRDAEIIAALAQLVEGRPARGFWKCRKQLRHSRKPWNHKRIYRVYKRMKELEVELSQLKRMHADLALENRAMKELIAKQL